MDNEWRTFYYHTNALGNIAALTEWDAGESEETIVERYTYDAYGRLLVHTPGADGIFGTSDDDYSATSSVGNPYGFTARRLDTETGLMYYRARQYSPLLGRFISRDPKGYVDGRNLHTAYFVPNYSDPLGTQKYKRIGRHAERHSCLTVNYCEKLRGKECKRGDNFSITVKWNNWWARLYPPDGPVYTYVKWVAEDYEEHCTCTCIYDKVKKECVWKASQDSIEETLVVVGIGRGAAAAEQWEQYFEGAFTFRKSFEEGP